MGRTKSTKKEKRVSQKRRRDDKLVQSIKYIESKRDRLIKLEKEILKITKDPEWLRAKNYIRCAVCLGTLDETPCKKNGYRTPKSLIWETDDIMYDDNSKVNVDDNIVDDVEDFFYDDIFNDIM